MAPATFMEEEMRVGVILLDQLHISLFHAQ